MEHNIANMLNKGNSIKIYCATGSERKIWHKWAEINNLNHLSTIDKNLPPAILYKCYNCCGKFYGTIKESRELTMSQQSLIHRHSENGCTQCEYGQPSTDHFECPYCTSCVNEEDCGIHINNCVLLHKTISNFSCTLKYTYEILDLLPILQYIIVP